jgi:hypothetical protein
MSSNDLQHDENAPVVTLGVGSACTPSLDGQSAEPSTDDPTGNATDAMRLGDHAHESKAPGGQPGNGNALRFGLRAAKLPAGCRYIENASQSLRLALEDAATAAHGPLTVYRSALIQSACRHETRAQLLSRYLRLASDAETRTVGVTTDTATGSERSSLTRSQGLGILDRAALLREISAATDSRDRCLERLKLDRDRRQTLIAQLYGAPEADGV